jgi:hypothetical protein
MGLFVIVVYHFRSRSRHIPDRDLLQNLRDSTVEIRIVILLLTVGSPYVPHVPFSLNSANNSDLPRRPAGCLRSR